MSRTSGKAKKDYHGSSNPWIKVVFPFILLFVSVMLPAQEKAKEEAPPKAVVFTPVDFAQSTESIAYHAIFYHSLETRMAELGFVMIPRSAVESLPGYSALKGEEAVSGEKLLEFAKKLGADSAVVSSYGIEGGKRLYVQIIVYDVRTGKIVASLMNSGYASLAGFDFLAEVVEAVSPSIQEYLKVFNRTEPTTYEAVEGIVFRSKDEGMQVRYESGQDIGSVSDGILKAPYVPFVVGTTIKVSMEKADHYPDSRNYILTEGMNEFELPPLEKKFRNELSLYWCYGQSVGAGLGYRYYPIPDYIFLSADNYFYIQYDFMDYSEPVYHDDASFSVGAYLFSSHLTPIRFGASVGCGVIVTSFTQSNMPTYTDYYLNFATLFLDLNLRPWTLYAQGALKYSLGIGNNILGQQYLILPKFGPFVSVGVRKKW